MTFLNSDSIGHLDPRFVDMFFASFRRRRYTYGDICGVYVLRDEDFDISCPLYVGQSENVPHRVSQHSLGKPRGRNPIKFTHYDFFGCKPDDLLGVEKAAISYFKPLLNKTHGGLSRIPYGRKHLESDYLDKLSKYMIHSGLKLNFLPRERIAEMIMHIIKTRSDHKTLLEELGHESNVSQQTF